MEIFICAASTIAGVSKSVRIRFRVEMAANLVPFRGGLALLGSLIDDEAAQFRRTLNLRNSSPGMAYHITLVTKEEVRSLRMHKVVETPTTIPLDHLYFLGVGGSNPLSGPAVYWIVCIWSAGKKRTYSCLVSNVLVLSVICGRYFMAKLVHCLRGFLDLVMERMCSPSSFVMLGLRVAPRAPAVMTK